MNWKEITISLDWTHFLKDGQPLFGKKFDSVLKFHAPGLAPVCEKEHWYFINEQGEKAISGPFMKAWGFYCHRSAVEDASGCYHIDPEGKAVDASRYDWCGNFQEDLCPVRGRQGNYFHIQKDGKPTYAERYRYAGDFKDGIACVRLQNGNFKHIDLRGRFLYNEEFAGLGIYHKGFATAKDALGWSHIDREGKHLYGTRFRSLEPFYNGQAFCESLEGEMGIVDKSGCFHPH